MQIKGNKKAQARKQKQGLSSQRSHCTFCIERKQAGVARNDGMIGIFRQKRQKKKNISLHDGLADASLVGLRSRSHLVESDAVENDSVEVEVELRSPSAKVVREFGGPDGAEPTRYGDWERKGRCIDF